MFLVCPARALIISVLISALYYSLKISLQLKFAIKKLKKYFKIEKVCYTDLQDQKLQL